MNDPNKRIDVNISSLLSLKAELLRKQEEVTKAKAKQIAEPFVPKKSSKLENPENESPPSPPAVEEYEDSMLLEKSRKVLEAKSKFYDKMVASGGQLNTDDNCLVLFNKKKQDGKPEEIPHYSSDEISDDDTGGGNHSPRNSDEEWIEYTDCLGRTRKCMKKDLQFFKKKDNLLAENIQPRLDQNAPMWMIDTKGSGATNNNDKDIRDDISEMTSVMSKHEQMKCNWEKKEEENIFKENVHYQDVLFDEARTHGVGYYGFSTDDEQRVKQMKALDEIRQKTLEAQKTAEAQRQQRDKIIAERVKAAKNRQRARLGLPPIEDEPEPEPQLFNTKEEEKRKKREEKQKRKKEKQEKLKEEERKRHVRPWDKNKDGVRRVDDISSDSEDEWNYKAERQPMSQEQWNEKKRAERNQEFAPISEIEPLPPPPPKRTFRAQNQHLPIPDESAPESLFFTTKKRPNKREFIKRNYTSVESSNSDEGIPIRSKLDREEEEADEEGVNFSNDSKRHRGAEVPPPPTFEYYGPSVIKHGKPPPKQNLEQSIEAGLKYLRNQSDKGVLPTKSSWTANADY